MAEIWSRICAAWARFAFSCGGSADAVEARPAAAATSTRHHKRRPQRRLPTTPKCSTCIAHDLFASRLTACVVGAPVEPRYFQVKSVEPDRSALSGVHALRPIGL